MSKYQQKVKLQLQPNKNSNANVLLFWDVSNDWYIIQNAKFCSNGKKSSLNFRYIKTPMDSWPIKLPTHIPIH